MTFSNSIISGVTLVREAIESEGFSTGVAGWRIDRDGNSEFNNVTVRGDLIVSDGGDEYIRVGKAGGIPVVRVRDPNSGNLIQMYVDDSIFNTPILLFFTDDGSNTDSFCYIYAESIGLVATPLARFNIAAADPGAAGTATGRISILSGNSDIGETPEISMTGKVIDNGFYTQFGAVNVNVSAGNSSGSTNVAFTTAFTSTPEVIVSHDQGPTAGARTVVATTDNRSTTGFRASVRTGDNSNFGGSATYRVAWMARGSL